MEDEEKMSDMFRVTCSCGWSIEMGIDSGFFGGGISWGGVHRSFTRDPFCPSCGRRIYGKYDGRRK